MFLVSGGVASPRQKKIAFRGTRIREALNFIFGQKRKLEFTQTQISQLLDQVET